MSRFHLHDERNIMKLCFGSIVRESISNVVATANKLRASIHPFIQQPNMKPSQLCLSPLRTRFTFCLNLPDPKVSKMEDLACSFLHFFHPLDHTFWSLLTGQFGRFTMQRCMLRTESRSLARTHQIPTVPKQKRCIRQLRYHCLTCFSVISVERCHPIFQTHDHQSQITTCSICGPKTWPNGCVYVPGPTPMAKTNSKVSGFRLHPTTISRFWIWKIYFVHISKWSYKVMVHLFRVFCARKLVFLTDFFPLRRRRPDQSWWADVLPAAYWPTRTGLQSFGPVKSWEEECCVTKRMIHTCTVMYQAYMRAQHDNGDCLGHILYYL